VAQQLPAPKAIKEKPRERAVTKQQTIKVQRPPTIKVQRPQTIKVQSFKPARTTAPRFNPGPRRH